MSAHEIARSSASVTTANANDYIIRLVKHFGHKVDVESEAGRATFRFSCGTANLAARDGGLMIEIEAPDAGGRTETEEVVESHLLRFAHREALGALHWTRT
ncbi:DUF2218 domain-containing protein [Acuticoccus yangtzensis]|uniref:DUF2218 domain-containing protein n=1 Tax=Acuticoccus yangtzensis TaxID=1443441 RepID=UPI0009497514|nr:DUF2218 domain-containing protein [Acuticoccus yangtzensis]